MSQYQPVTAVLSSNHPFTTDFNISHQSIKKIYGSLCWKVLPHQNF